MPKGCERQGKCLGNEKKRAELLKKQAGSPKMERWGGLQWGVFQQPAMGIIRKLGIASHYLPYADAQKIHLFERRCRHEIRALRPKADIKTDQANATERFANHVNNCLAKEGLTLTPTARSQLCTYVAEIIDNAENHAGMVDWTIQGYIDTGLEHPECEIVIFSFGKSIAETLEALPFNSYMSHPGRLYRLQALPPVHGPRCNARAD